MKLKIVDKVILAVSEKWYNKLMLKRAVTDAKQKWLKSGKQQFVLFIDNVYIVTNKAIIDKLNKKRKIKFTHRTLMNASVYVTPASGYINI